MFWSTVRRRFCIILIALGFSFTRGVKIVELSVPSLADPREELILGCRFDMGGEELNSVKWYKDEQEFFRYTPHRQPHVMSFPVAGVYLSKSNGGKCGTDRCTVRLASLTTAHSSGAYRCEVSTEAPTFRVAFETANVTVAALGRSDPIITGLLPFYSPGDLITLNCTSSPSDPAPSLIWLINGLPASAATITASKSSRPDSLGLITRSATLKLNAEKRHFKDGILQIHCVVRMTGIPAPERRTMVTAAIRDKEQRNVLSNQKLFWPSSAGKSLRRINWLPSLLTTSIFLLTCS